MSDVRRSELGEEDVLAALDEVAVDHHRTADAGLPEGQIEDVMQAEGNEGPFDDAENQGADVARGDTEQAADAADHAGFDQELGDDALALGTDGLADTDLPGALGDGDQHDVHNADAADGQGDGGNAAQEAYILFDGSS